MVDSWRRSAERIAPAVNGVCRVCRAPARGKRRRFCSEKCVKASRKIPPVDRTCAQCSAPFTNPQRKRFCTDQCASDFARAKYNKSPFAGTVSTSSVGAAHEMLVCVDLLRRGYDVFRSVSPHAACDMLILNAGATRRVEVATVQPKTNGELSVPAQKAQQAHRYDCLAMVSHDGTIEYRPALESLWTSTIS